jgi:lipopolysaccharide transport system permease protein
LNPHITKLVLEPGRAEKNYWRDLWRYRELFYFLAWRDILVRYKQTVIGIAWAVLRPFLTMLIFTAVFSKVANLPAPGGVPYALLVFAAMLPWQFFATSLTEASNSLVGNVNLISKVYFPRLVIPAGSVITSFVDFIITLFIMAGMMAWYRFCPDWRVLTLPLFVALASGTSFGIGLWLCALTVQYRDFRYITPFIVQIGLYLSPVGFSSEAVRSKVGETLFYFYSFNPMVGIIDGFRWALLRGESPLSALTVLTSVLLTLALCASGIWYFRRMEKTFADVI